MNPGVHIIIGKSKSGRSRLAIAMGLRIIQGNIYPPEYFEYYEGLSIFYILSEKEYSTVIIDDARLSVEDINELNSYCKGYNINLILVVHTQMNQELLPPSERYVRFIWDHVTTITSIEKVLRKRQNRVLERFKVKEIKVDERSNTKD